jgi:formylglycine-generating enzyme required for sulfatase activity
MPFHVFLSHSSADKPAVEELACRLAKEGIQAWLDKWNLIPGDPWQAALEKALAESETCAVFVGPSGFGSWQNEEMRAAIDQRVRDSGRRFRVIPVLLPGAERAERSSLPTFLSATTWVEFRDSLEDPDALRRLVCGIRGIEPGAGPGQALYEGQCPYRGLRVFGVDDAPFFFGREALVQWLLDEVRPVTEGQPVDRFLAIVGASGSGKSSVARAGLVAALKHNAIPGSTRWLVAICRPGPNPLESLAVALSRAINVGQGAPALAELIAEFQKNEKTLHLIARQSLPENAPDMRLVVVVDQFEEVFTLCREEELREALIRNLLYAAKVAQGQTLVVLTMRADFYGKCAANAELAAAFSDHHELVGPMTEDELRRAIERPTQLVGCELEAGLVDLLMQDVRHQPGALPLLQHALLELWNKREGWRLTVKAYQEIGKLEGALQRRADATLKAFSQDEQELCRRTFLRLTQPGEGTEDTKRRASMQELLSLSGKSRDEEDIIQKLADASLLTTEGDLTHRDAFVEVAHEALIRNWSQLRKWIDADRAGLRTRTRLTEAARDWKNGGHDPAYLYTGVRLAVAKEWEASHPGELSADEAEFLRCSREAQEQREATELGAARKLAKALKERAEEAEKREQEEKASGELRERLAREEKDRQQGEIKAAQRLAEEQKARAELSEEREKEQKKAARKLRRRAWIAAGLGVIALILGAIACSMMLSAEERARVAEEQARSAKIADEKARRLLERATKDHPWVNSLGMKFVPVAGTQVLFSIWDTRVQDFRAFLDSTGYDATGGMLSLGKEGWMLRAATWKEPGFSQGANHPVVGVSWRDAKEFCKWLTKRERSAGDLPFDREYRLPKDEEWSAAVGLKNEVGGTPEERKKGQIGLYPWDFPQKRDKSWPPPVGAGNYAGEEAKNGDWPSGWPVIEGYNDGYPRTSPVGSFSANQFGLYDMGGNVWQWCEDLYASKYQYRVWRGASWAEHYPDALLASFRVPANPDDRHDHTGFRCVVAVESSR